jgi:tRNA(Ile2) C34 agmatinyltransferase TiaS
MPSRSSATTHNQHRQTAHGHHFGADLDCLRCGQHYGAASAVCVPTRPVCPACAGPLRTIGRHGTVLRCRVCEYQRRNKAHAALEASP